MKGFFLKRHILNENFLFFFFPPRKFNSTHVVKLLGVVSHGSPPLVLMEKMANGSLKDYLERMKKKKKDQQPTEKVDISTSSIPLN